MKVKPLEWKRTNDEMGKNGWRFKAVSPFGHTYVTSVLVHGQYGECWDLNNGDDLHRTLQAAKNAAQDDFDQKMTDAFFLTKLEGLDDLIQRLGDASESYDTKKPISPNKAQKLFAEASRALRQIVE